MFQSLKGILGIGKPSESVQAAKKEPEESTVRVTGASMPQGSVTAPTEGPNAAPAYVRKRSDIVLNGVVLSSVAAVGTARITHSAAAAAPVEVVSSDSSVHSAETSSAPKAAGNSSGKSKSGKRESKSKSERGRTVGRPADRSSSPSAGLRIPRKRDKLYNVTLRPLPSGYVKRSSGVPISISGKHGGAAGKAWAEPASVEGESRPLSALSVPDGEMQQASAVSPRDSSLRVVSSPHERGRPEHTWNCKDRNGTAFWANLWYGAARHGTEQPSERIGTEILERNGAWNGPERQHADRSKQKG